MFLKDKVAIVTGGSRGIGEAIVLELARQGAKVAFNFVKSEDKALKLKKQIEEKGGEALTFRQDVKDYDAIKVMVEGVRSHFGRLDIIVNNAGILRDKALMLMEEQDWEETLAQIRRSIFPEEAQRLYGEGCWYGDAGSFHPERED